MYGASQLELVQNAVLLSKDKPGNVSVMFFCPMINILLLEIVLFKLSQYKIVIFATSAIPLTERPYLVNAGKAPDNI